MNLSAILIQGAVTKSTRLESESESIGSGSGSLGSGSLESPGSPGSERLTQI